LYVLVLVAHDRRELVHSSVTAHPTSAWIRRQLIAATPWGRVPRCLIRDRDIVHGRDFVPRARGLGIETLLTPVRAPRANAIAERLVGTLRRECLDRVIVLGEAHPGSVLGEFVQHYNAERPHRSLTLETPVRRPMSEIRPGSSQVRPGWPPPCLVCSVMAPPLCRGARGRDGPHHVRSSEAVS
jgi:transposase InsO family protein